MFSRPVSSGWKPVPTSSRLASRPRRCDLAPSVGSVIRLRIFRSVRFAGAVAADDADDLAGLDRQDTLQAPRTPPGGQPAGLPHHGASATDVEACSPPRVESRHPSRAGAR